MTTNRRAALPRAVTIMGLALGLYGLAARSPWALAVSMALDVLDGFTARFVRGATRFGASLDWTTDVVLANLGAWSIGIPWLSLALVPIQAHNHANGTRVSMRAGVFVLCGAVFLDASTATVAWACVVVVTLTALARFRR